MEKLIKMKKNMEFLKKIKIYQNFRKNYKNSDLIQIILKNFIINFQKSK